MSNASPAASSSVWPSTSCRRARDPHEQRVPAARDQAHVRRVERIGLQEVRGDVAVEVVDGHERQPARGRERLGAGEPDEQRADEPRAPRDRDALDVVEPRAGPGERVVDDRVDQLEVMARGDLGHDAAVASRARPATRSRCSGSPRRG